MQVDLTKTKEELVAELKTARREIIELQKANTEVGQGQEAFRESEKQFQDLIDHIPGVSVHGYDKDGTVLYWNKASETIYGYTAEEALGKNLADLIIPHELRPLFLKCLEIAKTLRNSGEFMPPGELELLHKDGHVVPVHSIHTCVCTKGRNPLLFCIDVDLSKHKQAEEKLSQAKEAAESSNKAKSEFLANMSHEIRTPLNGVLGMLQLLRETPVDSGQAEYIDMALSSGAGLLEIINDILDLSKIECGKMEIRCEEFASDNIFNSIQNTFASLARAKPLRVLYHIDPDIPPVLRGDNGRIKQILFNLVGNAIKFTEQGEVKVRAYPETPVKDDGSFLLGLEVSDTGIGIAGDKLETIFDPFTQIDGSHTRRYAGTGLGLDIVKRLVGLMQGEIHIKSEEEKGTIVRVTLPLESSKMFCPLKKEPREDEAFASPLVILLAEDDAANRFFVKHILEKHGHAVTWATTGLEVLMALKQKRFDLIFMDVQMPVMDGIEATRRIRSGEAGINDPGISIIALTAHAMQGDREKFLKAGMDWYITKPMDVKMLRKAIDRVVVE